MIWRMCSASASAPPWRWREGQGPVPDAVMAWIEGLAGAVAAVGPPPVRVKVGHRPSAEADEWAEWG